MKNIKKLALIFVFALCSVFAFVGAGNAMTAKAAEAFPQSGEITVVDGASLKLNADGGIRFLVKMNGATADFIKANDDVELVAHVAPAKAFSGRSYADLEGKAVTITADKDKIYEEDGDWYANFCLVNILEENRTLDFSARAYVISGDEVLKQTEDNANAVRNFYGLVDKAFLYSQNGKNYSEDILNLEAYNWYGTETYPVTVDTLEKYNTLVERINGGLDVASKALEVKASLDLSSATEFDAGKSLPSATKYVSVVTYMAGDRVVHVEKVEKNQNAVYADTVTKTEDNDYEYTFRGWNTADGETAVLTNITEDMTVYADFKAYGKTRITFSSEIALHCGDTLPSSGATSNFGENTIVYTYSADGETYVDSSDGITVENGNTYYVKASVAATDDYKSAEAILTLTATHDYKTETKDGITTMACDCGTKTVTGTLKALEVVFNASVSGGVLTASEGELDLTEVYGGDETVKLTVDGNEYDIAATSGKVEVKNVIPASVYGEKEVTIAVTDGKATYNVTAPVTFVTKVIKTTADYSGWIAIAKACESSTSTLWGGYFRLGANITASTMVTFPRNQTDGSTGFKGTFDGCGYGIDGLNKTANDSTAFMSCMTKDGVLRNISFTNAKFSVPNGNFLCSGGRGLIENVYVKYAAITDGHTGGWSGTIANRILKAYTTTKSIFIDASEAEISGNGLYFRLLGANIVDGNNVVPDGMFAICPENYTVSQATPSMVTGKIYAYASFDGLKADTTAMSVIKNFDTDFWTIKEDGTPEPKNLPKNLPKMVKLDDCEADLDITVENGTAKVSMKELAVNYDSSSVNFGTVSSFKFDGVELDNGKVTVADGIITIALSAFGFNYGVHSVTIEDTNGNILSFNVDIITKTIMNATDYSNWIIIAKACESGANFYGGYFRLGANISVSTMISFGRSSTNGTTGFKGTFDGCGYAIDGITATATSQNIGGFITCMTSTGVLKNIAFTNASVTLGNFLTSGGTGTIENVYVNYASIAANDSNYNGTIMNFNGTLKAVFIDASNATVGSYGANYRLIYGNGSPSCNGAYAIIPASGYTTPSNAINGNSILYRARAYFANYEELRTGTAADSESNTIAKAREVMSTWDTTYWEFNDSIPQFKTKG